MESAHDHSPELEGEALEAEICRLTGELEAAAGTRLQRLARTATKGFLESWPLAVASLATLGPHLGWHVAGLDRPRHRAGGHGRGDERRRR